MKNFIKLLIFGVIFTFFSFNAAFSDELKPTVAVITDINHRAGTIYLVTGASTDIIASDIISKLNESNLVYAPVLGDSMQKITRHLNMYTQTFFDEYKYNYNIDYINLKRITQELHADYILMVTSGLDVQSNFLKETILGKLGISGFEPVKPTYRLTTLLTLIDTKNEAVLWQELYKKDISAQNYDIGNVQFAPSYAQLSKIKEYSRRVAEHVTPIINVAVHPELATKKEVGAVEIKKKDVTEDKRIYYPVIHRDKIHKPQFMQNVEMPKFERPRFERQKKEKYIENVNNLTPKSPAFEPEKDFSAVRKYAPVQEEAETHCMQEQIQKNEPEIDCNQDAEPEILPGQAEKPRLKPAVHVTPADEVQNSAHPVNNVTPKENENGLPHYNWNLKNIYENQPKNGQQKSFWIFKRNKAPKIKTVIL